MLEGFPRSSMGQLVSALRGKAEELEGSSGMRLGFHSFISAHKLSAENVRYSDYVVVRLLFEATRDAGTFIGQSPINRRTPTESGSNGRTWRGHPLWNQRLRRNATNSLRSTRSW